jgi:hypothetical protein
MPTKRRVTNLETHGDAKPAAPRHCRECGQLLTAPKTIQRRLCRSCWRVAKVCSNDGGRVRNPASEAVVAITTITSRHHTAGPDFTAAGRRGGGATGGA